MAEQCNINLSEAQLQKLVKVMYYKGVEGIHTIKFGSVYERAKYLKCSRDAYLNTKYILSTTEWAVNEFKDDELMAPTVKTYAGYVKFAILIANKVVGPGSQRAEYIEKLKIHTGKVLEVLREHKFSPLNEARLVEFVKDVGELSKSFFKYEAQTTTRVSRNVYRAARIYALTFEHLFVRFQTVLGYKGPFINLGTMDQVAVIDKVIELTGGRKLIQLGKKTVQVLDKYAATAVFALTAFVVVVDVYSANPDKRYETAVKSVISVGSSFLIGWVQGVIIVDVAFALICTGQPLLIALGIAIGVATYFGGNYIQNFIDTKLIPIVLDFMNHHNGVKQVVDSVLSFPEHLISTTGHPALTVIAMCIISPAGTAAFFLGRWINNNNNNNNNNKPDTSHPASPLPISTYGIKIHGPQVPNGGFLALQIASKIKLA